MNRIELTRLRDAACERIPVAKKHLEEARHHWQAEQNLNPILAFDAMRTMSNRASSSVELAAAELLSAVCAISMYDPEAAEYSQEECGELLCKKIADDARVLYELIGLPITELPEPSVAPKSAEPPAMVATSANWTHSARAIADECFDRDSANKCRDSMAGYALRVMDEMQKRGIHGPRGRINNPKTIERDALQGEKWWKYKNK
jgi:hypothetical protein